MKMGFIYLQNMQYVYFFYYFSGLVFGGYNYPGMSWVVGGGV
jgi:hypothetical protein